MLEDPKLYQPMVFGRQREDAEMQGVLPEERDAALRGAANGALEPSADASSNGRRL